ncbi:hypothetical protein ACWC5C_38750 [Streptomyces sp. NPDC001700]
MSNFEYAVGFFLSLASIAGAIATPFVIVAARRTVARIPAQLDQKEQ